MATPTTEQKKPDGERPCCPKAHPAPSTVCVCGGWACPTHGHVCHPRWTLD